VNFPVGQRIKLRQVPVQDDLRLFVACWDTQMDAGTGRKSSPVLRGPTGLWNLAEDGCSTEQHARAAAVRASALGSRRTTLVTDRDKLRFSDEPTASLRVQPGADLWSRAVWTTWFRHDWSTGGVLLQMLGVYYGGTQCRSVCTPSAKNGWASLHITEAGSRVGNRERSSPTLQVRHSDQWCIAAPRPVLPGSCLKNRHRS
jgi:hypothetical protein